MLITHGTFTVHWTRHKGTNGQCKFPTWWAGRRAGRPERTGRRGGRRAWRWPCCPAPSWPGLRPARPAPCPHQSTGLPWYPAQVLSLQGQSHELLGSFSSVIGCTVGLDLDRNLVFRQAPWDLNKKKFSQAYFLLPRSYTVKPGVFEGLLSNKNVKAH